MWWWMWWFPTRKECIHSLCTCTHLQHPLTSHPTPTHPQERERERDTHTQKTPTPIHQHTHTHTHRKRERKRENTNAQMHRERYTLTHPHTSPIATAACVNPGLSIKYTIGLSSCMPLRGGGRGLSGTVGGVGGWEGAGAQLPSVSYIMRFISAASKSPGCEEKGATLRVKRKVQHWVGRMGGEDDTTWRVVCLAWVLYSHNTICVCMCVCYVMYACMFECVCVYVV